ncbi:MAG: alkaline phosphatase family protein [Chromatiales bacterium]|jgi:phospholipase C
MDAVMPQIKNIVFLMMENRSLDNLLGWLYSNSKPKHFYPASNTKAYNGLIAGRYHNPAHSLTGVKQYPVVPIPDKHSKQRVPAYDPYEAMREAKHWNGVMNQLFGNQDMIKATPKKGSKASMRGFLQDYYVRYMVDWQGLDILWTYTPAQLPHINKLAHHYAVSDHWFSSVPTQTNPNRAFSICGTSLGREANANLQAVEQYNVPTIFNSLAQAGKSWGLYYEDIWHDKKCFTEHTFPQISKAKQGEVGSIEQFRKHAKNGSLPAFSYLEPKWGYGKGQFYVQGNDYHPPTKVAPGDAFLNDIYTAIRNGPQWKDTLFIVTFDEHGGTYDHIQPGWNAVNPDGIKGTKWGFDFELYGARVPTLLISPYVKPQTVFREPEGSKHSYDHTSFIKTLLLWAGVDPASAGLGKRVEVAPSFAGVLSDKPVNKSDVSLEAVAFTDIAMEQKDAPEPVSDQEPANMQSLDELFGGVSFSSVRDILNQNDNLDDIKTAVAAYRQDPAEFEARMREHANG